jgi:lambda family phage portal protein
VLHIFDGAPTAVRGISVLVAALKVVRQYEQFADATLVAALIQAILVASVESDAPTPEIMRALQSQEEQEDDAELQPGAFDEYMAKRFEWYEKAQVDLGKYGKIAHMFAGEKLNLHKSEHPNTGYVDFSKGLLREIARCLGTTYEQFTGDYVGATYSSIRMGIADVWPLNLYRRAVVPARFYQGVFEAWLEEDIEAGDTPFPGGIEAFLAQRQAVCRAEWRGPPKPTADDEKTAKAQQIARQEGWVSTEQIAAEYGNDHRTVIESQARTNELRETNKLSPLPSNEGGAPKDQQKGEGGARERAQNEAEAKGRDARLVAAVMRRDWDGAAQIAEVEFPDYAD